VQFFNSLYKVMQFEGVNPAVAIRCDLSWQARRAMGKFPCELRAGLLKELGASVPGSQTRGRRS
jgi:hypothetical protein